MIYDIDFYIVLICFLVSSKYLELCLGGFTPIFDGFLVSSKYLELCLENVFYMIHIIAGSPQAK
jgi:hypothetical protein